jgi:hypothetical protein
MTLFARFEERTDNANSAQEQGASSDGKIVRDGHMTMTVNHEMRRVKNRQEDQKANSILQKVA